MIPYSPGGSPRPQLLACDKPAIFKLKKQRLMFDLNVLCFLSKRNHVYFSDGVDRVRAAKLQGDEHFIKPGIDLSTVLSSYSKGSDFRHPFKGMPFHVPNLVHWPRRSIAWFMKRKTIILIDINYTSSNAFTNVVRSWLESDPVTVGLSSGAFPNLLLPIVPF